jgi:hypothetical protein
MAFFKKSPSNATTSIRFFRSLFLSAGRFPPVQTSPPSPKDSFLNLIINHNPPACKFKPLPKKSGLTPAQLKKEGLELPKGTFPGTGPDPLTDAAPGITGGLGLS